MTPIAIKDLGIDDSTGLQKIIEVYRIDINSDTENINIEYRINYLAPKNSESVKTISSGFNRYNRQAVLDSDGKEIKSENLKFEALRNSHVGQMIAGMIQLDLNDYPNLEQD